ncbi:MAG: ISAs1 family transposase [Bacteroidales bacterium]|jgi:predicted transposase YbfD/YdcC
MNPEQEFQSLSVLVSEFLTKHATTIKVDKIPTKVITRLLCLFDDVPDPRKEGMIVYPLNELLLCIFLALLAGGETYEDIAHFWTYHPRLYKKLFKKTMIPSHDTFRRIISIIPPEKVNTVMVEVLLASSKNLRTVLELPKTRTLYAVDGKELRGSGRKYGTDEKIPNLQILNVYEQNTETCLYSIPITDKRNEIPHARKILQTMNLKDSIVTFDAMHTQYETTNIISENRGDYLGGLKGNQGKLQEFAEDLFGDASILASLKANTATYYPRSTIEHNQLEQREYYYYALSPQQKKGEFGKWHDVHALVCYDKTVCHNVTGKEGFERRFYLTSLKDLPTAAYCIGRHWGIENNLHWMLDTVLREDECQVVDRQAANNLSSIKKTCLSLYKLYKSLTPKKMSVRSTKKVFGWAFEDALAQVLTLCDEKTLRKALMVEKK